MLPIQTLLLLMFSALPPVNPQLPLIVLKTAINATANTAISQSITIVTPKAVGYSQWLGYWQSFNGIIMTTAPPASVTAPCTSLPCPNNGAAFGVQQ